MNSFAKFALLVLTLGTLFSCSKSAPKNESDEPFPVKYENELFSIRMPKGWTYDDSKWEGLDSIQNVVDIYNPDDNLLWIHITKCFIPFEWKDIEEATNMAKFARMMSTDDTVLLDEIDSIEVGGYPASILYFANFVDNDTIIQKQYVTYLQDSHIVVYFNENFYYQNTDQAQEIGDKIIETVILKKVENPLEKDSAFIKSFEEGSASHPVDDEQLEKVRRMLNDIPDKE